jgi:hypothetical protein
MILSIFLAMFIIYFFQGFFSKPINLISLYVLVDNDGRISYTGSYEDCKKQLTNDYKLIKLEGTL